METYVAIKTLVHLMKTSAPTSGVSFNFGVVESFCIRHESHDQNMFDA